MTYYYLVTNTSELSREILQAALRGLTHEREKIEEQIQEIERVLRGSSQPAVKKASAAPTPAASGAGAATKKRTMSPEARKRIAEAQRKRWAVSKGSETAAPAKEAVASKKKAVKKATKGKRVMSPEVRARMAEAQRKRWAAKKQ